MTDWIGVVQSVKSTILDSNESAIIDIRISEKKSYLLFTTSAVNVTTFAGTLGDAAAAVALGTDPETSIVRGNPVFDQVVALKKGDKVKFSGQLIEFDRPGECFYELSMTTNGKIRWPEYAARFTNIEKIN